MASAARFAAQRLAGGLVLLCAQAGGGWSHAADDVVAPPQDAGDSEEVLPQTIPVDDESEAPPASPSAVPHGATLLDPIVVTASKREESARTVGASITALGGEHLEQLGVRGFEDFAGLVPGLSWERNVGAGSQQPVLRGISAGSASITVGVYLDETPVGSSSIWSWGDLAPDFAAVDLDRIEVLRGPHGTLYGANTLGGLLKYVTRDPEPGQWTTSVSGDAVSMLAGGDNYAARGVVNVPLGDTSWAARVVASHERRGGYVDSPRLGLEDSDALAWNSGRGVLRGPIGEDLMLRLSAGAHDIDRNGVSWVDRDLATRAPKAGRYDRGNRFPEPSRDRVRIASAVLDWTPGGIRGISATSWQQSMGHQLIDYTDFVNGVLGTPESVPFANNFRFATTRLVQEFRVQKDDSTPGEAAQWLAGVFATDEDSFFTQSIYRYDTPDGDVTPGVRLADTSLPYRFREYAAFGHLVWPFNPAFGMAVGARVARNEQDFRQTSSGVVVDPTQDNDVHTVAKEDNFTWLIGPQYRVDPDLMLYARVANAYRPGTPNATINLLTAPGARFKPFVDSDSLVCYEAGVKATLLDGEAILDVSVFLADWDDIQLLVTRDGVGALDNAGEARSQGVELAGYYRALQSLTLGISGAWLDAKLTEDAPNLPGKAGDRLPLVPEYSGALTGDFRFGLPFGLWGQALASYRYTADRESYFARSETRRRYPLGAYDLLDLRISAHGAAYTLTLFGNNLFDEMGDVSAFSNVIGKDPEKPVWVAVTPPRTVGLSLRLEF